MKRHHIAALASILFAGLYLYQSFRDGLNDLPIWGIGFIFVAVVAFFYERWKSWLMSRLVVFSETYLCVIMLIIMGAMLVRSLVIGDTIGTGGWIGALIAGSIYMALRSIKKVRPWLRFIPIIVVAALLIIEVRSLLVQRHTDIKAMSLLPRVESAPAADSDRQALSSLRQKTMDILTSGEVRGEIRAAADAGVPHEALESLSSFKDFMVSKGMTEFSMLDEAPSHFQKIFQKHHPGKGPSDLDAEMQVRLIEMIQEFGVDAGRDRFVRTPEVAIWAAARFDLFQHGGKNISQWMDTALTDASRDAVVSAPTGLQDSIPANAPLSDVPLSAPKAVSPHYAQPADVTELELSQEALAIPPDKPPKQIENEVNAGVSTDSFDKAQQLIDQYGIEEGLRRLREIDPEAARQFERRGTPSRDVPSSDGYSDDQPPADAP